MSESDMSNESKQESTLHTTAFESLLTENYKLFAIVGVFGALSVYLYNLRGGVPNQFVDWGVAGALLMFFISSFTLVYKLTHRFVHYDEIAWTFRTLTGVILVGLIAVMYGVFGIITQFLGEVMMLGAFVVVGVIYTVYLNVFPWAKFNDIANVSSETAENITKAPEIANTWSVVVILFSGIIIPDLPDVDGYSPFMLIPATVLGIGTHLLLSFALRKRYLAKDTHSSGG